MIVLLLSLLMPPEQMTPPLDREPSPIKVLMVCEETTLGGDLINLHHEGTMSGRRFVLTASRGSWKFSIEGGPDLRGRYTGGFADKHQVLLFCCWCSRRGK